MVGHAGEGGLDRVKSAGKLAALHAGVDVFVDDVDAHCKRARTAGANVLLEPADQPWGDRMHCTGVQSTPRGSSGSRSPWPAESAMT